MHSHYSTAVASMVVVVAAVATVEEGALQAGAGEVGATHPGLDAINRCDAGRVFVRAWRRLRGCSLY